MKKQEKDPNYLIKLEKAIEEKYGKEATQHPLSNWDDNKEKDYIEQIKQISIKENQRKSKEVLVDDKLFTTEDDRTCPICERYSFLVEDDLYFTKYKCCRSCYTIKYDWKRGNE